MPLTHSRTIKSRAYRGQKEAETLLAILRYLEKRKWKHRPAFENVLLAIKLMQKAEELTTSTEPEAKRELKELITAGGTVDEMLARPGHELTLDELLERCRVRPVISGSKPGRLEFDFTATMRPGRRDEMVFPRAAAIWSLAQLAQLGLARRIRQCTFCKKWFFARFEHQTHCSGGKCRIREISSSERWKEYRAQKSKDYYWLHKRGVVKEKL